MTDHAYFDAHCDTAIRLMLRQMTLQGPAIHIDSRRCRNLGRYAQFFAFCTTCWRPGDVPEELYRRSMDFFRGQLAENTDWIRLCGSRDEVEQAWENGRCAALISLEGAEAIGCDPGRLEEAAEESVRLIGLTWNGHNALCDSHEGSRGLTEQGREFVRRAQRLGILIDVSHASDQAFYDLCDITEGPIVASHSDSRAVCDNSRNLTDDMFRLLAESGGCAGLNLYGEFLSEDAKPTMEAVYRHLDHFLSLGGDGHLCLGGDWDGIDDLPEGMTGVDGWSLIPPYLAERGIPEDTIDRLTSKALLRQLDLGGCQPVGTE